MSSLRAVRRKACNGKQRYASKDGAYSEALRLRRAGYGRISAYLCRFCRDWHVGHTPRRVAQSMAARRSP